MHTYFAIVHKDPDSSFGISFPDLPGCFSAADSDDDLLVEAQLALTLFASDQEALPSSRSVSELLEDPSIKADVAAGAFFIAIPLINASHKARYNLMLDTDLVAGIDKTARAIGMNRSEFVSEAVAARLSEQVGAVVRQRTGNVSAQSRVETTGSKVSSAASKILRSKTASKAEKAVAASALTQTKSVNETTGKKVASAASKILHNPKASKVAKSVAASTLTQKVKKK